MTMIAYPIEGSLGFAFRNTSSLEGKIGLLKEVDSIPEGYNELTEEKWGGPLPVLREMPTRGFRYRVDYLDSEGQPEAEVCWAASENDAAQMTADLWLDGSRSGIIRVRSHPTGD